MRGIRKAGKKWAVFFNKTYYGVYATEEEAIAKIEYLISLNPLLAKALLTRIRRPKDGKVLDL